jgi:Protein of unknown function (DUF3800)
VKVMFLDESGNHAVDVIDPSYPVFALGGVIVDRAYCRTVVEPRIRELKSEFFDNPDLILHTADIIRTKNGFEALKDIVVRGRFYDALNAMMRELDYLVVACAIKKEEYVLKHRNHAADPYLYSLDIVVERFSIELGDVEDGGIIFAEKRRPDLDRDLDLAWERLKRQGTGDIGGQDLDRRIIDLSLKEKRLNLAGLQLADLVVSPIGRAIIGKPPREDWEIVRSKFRRIGDRYRGHGLVVLP